MKAFAFVVKYDTYYEFRNEYCCIVCTQYGEWDFKKKSYIFNVAALNISTSFLLTVYSYKYLTTLYNIFLQIITV